MMRKSPIRDRWREPERKAVAAEFFRRLFVGAPVHDLPLGEHEGRLDMRGVVSPRPVYDESWRWNDWIIDRVRHQPKMRGGVVQQVDFSESDLYRWICFDTRFADCVFDRASCTDWKTWTTEFERCTFRSTDLRRSVLGAFNDGRWGMFRNVDFSGADLRRITCWTADFIDCDFSNAEFSEWETRSCVFVRCRFAGIVRNVIFHETYYKSPKPFLNRMEGVDFSQAELRHCEFRHVDLSRVQMPESPNHLIIRNARRVLECALERLKSPEAELVRKTGLGGGLESDLAWLHPASDVVVCHVKDLEETDSGTGVCREFLMEVMAECGDKRAPGQLSGDS